MNLNNLNIDLNTITAQINQINEGHRLIREAIDTLKSKGIDIIEYYYHNHSLQIYGEEKFAEMFPACVKEPRVYGQFPAMLSVNYNGLTFFTLSETPIETETVVEPVIFGEVV